MVTIASASSLDRDPRTAVRDCLSQLEAGAAPDPGHDPDKATDPDPDLVMIQVNAALDVDIIRECLRDRYPSAALHGATSCQGTMTDKRLCSAPDAGMAIWTFHDGEGDTGTGLRDYNGDPGEAAAQAILDAMASVDRFGEIPQLVWVSAAPGDEEAIIAGIQSVVGRGVPIVGGSVADNTVSGGWQVFDRGSTTAAGLVVSAWFSPLRIGTAFHSGYRPTDRKATVTSARGRVVYSLDNRPALDLYREWNGPAMDAPSANPIPDPASHTVNILQATTLSPLGRRRGNLAGASMFVLSHPETARPDGGISLFTNVAEGEELHLMEGTVESLIHRPGNVCRSAMDMIELNPGDIKGAILVYCAGCMLAVRDRMNEVHGQITQALPGVPFITAFTFGEQGPVLDVENRHGNLMISAALFGET
ncbi:MAG: FIST N-terminal domain-containing protein [Roseibium sp.]|uniref:FIST signal transduction protein n=1 Tax=Roseibium sp. TaxID=1936156 RepID=UPI0032986A0F